MLYGIEYIRDECKKRKIALYILERDCGFANGYLNPKRLNKIPYDRALKIAGYLNADINRIFGDKPAGLAPRDERDIAYDFDKIINKISNKKEGPVYYNGVEIDDASINFLKNAIEYALRTAKEELKVKYNPYQNESG